LLADSRAAYFTYKNPNDDEAYPFVGDHVIAAIPRDGSTRAQDLVAVAGFESFGSMLTMNSTHLYWRELDSSLNGFASLIRSIER
jgi:hypothetical protein